MIVSANRNAALMCFANFSAQPGDRWPHTCQEADVDVSCNKDCYPAELQARWRRLVCRNPGMFAFKLSVDLVLNSCRAIVLTCLLKGRSVGTLLVGTFSSKIYSDYFIATSTFAMHW